MRRGKIRRKEKPSGGAPLTIETGSLFQIVTTLCASSLFRKAASRFSRCGFAVFSTTRPSSFLSEGLVVHLERHRLARAGRDDLSRKVQWVAVEIGDGLGFDVLSFDDLDESEKLIEVKTTGLGKFFPFYVTGNEVRCSEDMTDQFHLFRVFDFGRTPRIYILTGSLNINCRLEPTQYLAMI